MITTLKLAGLSAILSAGMVTAYEAPKAIANPTQTKLYYDRIAPEPSAPVHDATGAVQRAAASDVAPICATRPYGATGCGAGPEGRAVRTITIERRHEPNTSTLIRLPATR